MTSASGWPTSARVIGSIFPARAPFRSRSSPSGVDSYEDAIRNAISLGGDADTMAAIAGGIAEAFYGGVPQDIRVAALDRLDPSLRAIVDEFTARFGDRPTERRR